MQVGCSLQEALCKRLLAEAKPQLLIFIIFGAPRVDLKSDCRDYETYHLKYDTIKCKIHCFLPLRLGRTVVIFS